MAAGGDHGGRGASGRPMEASSTGEDRFADLHSELSSLRRRVEELELENQKLLSQMSLCRCSKGEDVEAQNNASIISKETSQGVHESSGVYANETVEPNKSSSSLNCAASSSPALEDAMNGLYVEKSASCKKNVLREEPGRQCSTIHHSVQRYIALKIMYFGQRFYGFASEAQMDPTVESEMFRALKRTKLLVGSRADSHYSRCGRTDKGVSSTGQVISLYLRSNLNDSRENTKNEKQASNKKSEEIDYVRVLNKALPKDIRVMGWCPVPAEFSARFSCLSREYRYLFWRGTLDILAMQKAAKKFIGVHDFRNFCKMDAVNVNNYRRQITDFDISSCNKRIDTDKCWAIPISNGRTDDDELWAMTIKGSAFLWHQVRCMVAVLFMIGQGLESPHVLDELLDINMTPRKPQYNMAPELPLILRFCDFKDANFICSSAARSALHEHLRNEFQTFMLQAAIFHEALGCLSAPEETPFELGKKKKGHIPLMLRPTEPSYEERRAKMETKTALKSSF